MNAFFAIPPSQALSALLTRASVCLAAGLLLASCDVGRVAPNAGDLSKAGDSDFLITDDEFAPRLVNITPFEYCTLASGDVVNQESECKDFEEISDNRYFNRAGLRFLFEFDKPVYYNTATQGQLRLTNATFVRQGADGSILRPVEIIQTNLPNGETLLSFEEVANPSPSGAYRYFTTNNDNGHILPLKPQGVVADEGEFTITLPDGVVYDVNPNGKRIYNFGGSQTFNYDNVPPVPTLIFDIEQMNAPNYIMSASADDLNGRGLDFSTIQVTLDWGETVIPSINVGDQLEDGDLFDLFCSGCPGGLGKPYAGGRAVGEDGNNPTSGVRESGTNAPLNSEYYFTLVEDDTSGDLLTKLINATRLTFQINPEFFQDLAGNVNTTLVQHVVSIDSTRPEVSFVTVNVGGERIVAGSRILGLGGVVDFTVEYTDEVTIPDFNEYGMRFIIGSNDEAVARLISSQQNLRGHYDRTWNFRYVIRPGDGDNAVGLNGVGANELDIPGNQYSGDRLKTDGSVVNDWISDISLLLGSSSNFAYDQVSWPVTDFVGKSLYEDFNDQGNTLFRNTSGRLLNSLHIDGMRPEIVTDSIDNLSKLLSGQVGVLTSTVTNGSKLAIAVPFSETVRNSLATGGIDFANMSSADPLVNSSITVTYCTNAASTAEDCDALTSETFGYDQALTQVARNTVAISPFRYRTIVYSKVIDNSIAGVRTVVASDLVYPYNDSVLPITDFTDHARNGFDSGGVITDSAEHGVSFDQVVNINIEGGEFLLRNINLVRLNQLGQSITVPDDTTADYQYNRNNRALYIEAVGSRDLLRAPGSNDAVLTIGVQDTTGAEVDVSSSSVSMKLDETGNQVRNTLLFYFNLDDSHGLLSDYDGISIKQLDLVVAANFVDDLGVTLDPAIANATVSPVLTDSRIKIDTHAPQCSALYITGRADGSSQDPQIVEFGTVQGYAQTLYLVLECDQTLVYNNFNDDASSDVLPFMPISFGTLDFVMDYDRIIDAENKVVFRFDVRPGLPGDGDMHMGADGVRTINWHVVNGARTGALGSDHQFFTDQADNALDLDALSIYNNRYIFEHDIVLSGGSYGSDILVDTRPYALEIVYPDPLVSLADNYRNAGTTWISGNTPLNTLGFSVRYGYYLDNSVVESIITLPVIADVSGDYQDGGGAALFAFAPQSVSDGTVNYSGTLDYGNSRDVPLKSVSDTISRYIANRAPFESHNVAVVNTNGEELSQPVIVNSPVNPALTSQSGVAQNTFPDLVVNNIQPKVASVSLFADTSGDGSFETLATGSANNGTIFFGNVYIAVGFDKPMSEEDISGTYLRMQVTDSNGVDVSVDASDIFFQQKADLPIGMQNLINAMPTPDNILVYAFVYAKTNYQGTAIRLNPGSGAGFLDEKIPAALDNLKDIYGNAYLPAAIPQQYYLVTLDARSDIASAEFIGAPFYYGDTITFRVTTNSRINVSRLTSSKALAQPLRLKIDEPGSVPVEIKARALSSSVSSELTSDANGSTTITFSYTLDGLDNQFNADTTSDFGLQPSGAIELCDISGQGVANCAVFATSNLTPVGSDGAPAILTLDNPQNYASQVASVLNRLVLVDQNDFTNSGIFAPFMFDDGSTLRSYATGDALDMGTELVFAMPVEMLNEQFGATTTVANSLVGSSSATQLLFSIYNGINQRRVNRLADFYDINVDEIRFSYLVQPGDLVHIKDASNDAIDYQSTNGLISSGDDLAIRVDTAVLFNGDVGNLIDGVEDANFGNPVWSQVVDVNNVVQQLEMNVSGDSLTIDTRPRVVSARAANPPAIVRAGVVVPIILSFDKEVYANDATLVLTDGVVDLSADLTQVPQSDNHDLPFEFTTTAQLGNSVFVKGIDLGNGFIRMQDNINGQTPLGADTTILTPIHITDLTVDNDAPEIIGVQLVDASDNPITGPVTYSRANGNDRMRLLFTVDKDLTYDGVGSANDLRFRVNLDQYEAGQNSNYYFYLDPASTRIRSFALELDVSNDVANNIQDVGTGITVVDPFLALTAGTIKDANSGNNLSLGLAAVKNAIEGFDVDIDNKQPYVESIALDPADQGVTTNSVQDDCETGFLCAGKNALVDFLVNFNEPVTLASPTSAYTFTLLSENGAVSFDAAPVSIPAGQTSYRFRLAAGNTGITFNNELFNRSLISSSLAFTAAGGIEDRAQNDFSDTNLLLLTGNRNIENLAVDTNDPQVSSVGFVGGEYGNGASVPLVLQFDKEVTVNGNPTINVTLGSATTTTQAFSYKGPVSNNGVMDHSAHEFAYSVDASTDNNQYDGASFPSPVTVTVTDYYTNRVTSLVLPGAGVVDNDVKIRPQNLATIVDIVVKRDNGQPVSTIDNSNDFVIFGSGDKVVFEVTYSSNVAFDSVASPTDDVYMLFDIDSTTDAGRAVYTSGNNSNTLVFELEVIDGYEDSNGISLNNTGIQFDSGSLVIAGTTDPAPFEVAGAFQSSGHADTGNVLTNVRLDTLPPATLDAASFSLDHSSWSGSAISTRILVDRNADRPADIVKYRVELFDGNDALLDTQYILNVPGNVDFPGAVNAVYAMPDASGDIALTIPQTMVNDSCQMIYARVFAVDQRDQESPAGVFTSLQGAGTSAMLRFETSPPSLNTNNANGDSTGDVVFNDVEGFPVLHSVSAEDACGNNGTMSYFYTITDTAGNVVIAEESINDYPITSASSPVLDQLSLAGDYVTTFRAVDALGVDASKDHPWQAFTHQLPLRYDFSREESVVRIGSEIISVANLGNGATVQNGAITRDPQSWDLKPLRTALLDSGYDNVAPMYEGNGAPGGAAAVFTGSTTSRPNLYVDNDYQELSSDTSQNKLVEIPSGNVTIYMVLTPPSYNWQRGQSIVDEASQAANNDYWPVFFLASGNYYPSADLHDLNAVDSALASLFSRESGDFLVHNTSSFVYPQASARQLIVYEITDPQLGNGKYALKVFVNGKLVDEDLSEDIDYIQGLGFDKLYFGALPYSASGAFSTSFNKLLGHNLADMRLHEFLLYSDEHSGASARASATGTMRDVISQQLAEKWKVLPMDVPEIAADTMLASPVRMGKQLDDPGYTKDGIALSCIGDPGSPDFPKISVTNIPADAGTILHFLIEQDRAGEIAGDIGHALFMNVPFIYVPSPPAGANYVLDPSTIPIPPSSIIYPFNGLCNGEGNNSYTFAVYASNATLSLPAPVGGWTSEHATIVSFENALVDAGQHTNITYKSHATFTFQASAALKDNLAVPPAAGNDVVYSLRLANGGYTGNALQVRRSSDNATSDIGFSGGLIDLWELEGFVTSYGQEATSDGFVASWYDQSGNGVDLLQPQLSRQPLLVSSGSVLRENALPIMEFSSTQWLESAQNLPRARSRDIFVFLLHRLLPAGLGNNNTVFNLNHPITTSGLNERVRAYLPADNDAVFWDAGGAGAGLRVNHSSTMNNRDTSRMHHYAFVLGSVNVTGVNRVIYKNGGWHGGDSVSVNSTLSLVNFGQGASMRVPEFAVYLSPGMWGGAVGTSTIRAISDEQRAYWGTP